MVICDVNTARGVGKGAEKLLYMRVDKIGERSMVRYCHKCGDESKEGDKFCRFCGANLESEETSVVEVAEAKVDKIYGPWMRGISTFFGFLFIWAAEVGWRWYFESELPLVLFCESFSLLIGILLLLLGLFQNYLCKRLCIDTKDKYTVVVIILILAWFILDGIEPEPPGGWWDY